MDSELKEFMVPGGRQQSTWEGFLQCSLGSWGRRLTSMKLGTEGGGPGPGSWGRKPSGVSEWDGSEWDTPGEGGRAEHKLWNLSIGCGMRPDVSVEAALSLAMGGGEQGGYQVELRPGQGLLGGFLRWG